MRLFTLILVGLLALIQYPLWLGKGGWFRVWELDRQTGDVALDARTGELFGLPDAGPVLPADRFFEQVLPEETLPTPAASPSARNTNGK